MNNLIQKIRVYGEDTLSAEELISFVIWGTKVKEKNGKLVKKLIKNKQELTNSLQFLLQITVEELMESGFTLEEATKLKALSGIFKKLSYPIGLKGLELNSSTDVAKLFIPELRYEKSEIVKIVILTNKNKVLKIETLSKGTSNSATVSPKDILSEPVRMKAARIILVHNHPSRRCNT